MALYPWASAELLAETSTLNSSEDMRKHREGEVDLKGRVFRRESDTYVSVHPCAKGEPVCADDQANEGEPFFFLYQMVFKRIKLRPPHRLREGVVDGDQRGSRLAASQQLGLHEGVLHTVQPFWAPPFSRRLPPLL